MADEQKVEGQEQQAEGNEQTPETPAVTPEAEAQKPSIPEAGVDEDGVPWKNRAKEYERKYHQTLEKFANFQKVPVETPKDDNEEIPATRAGVKAVLNELTREEVVATQVLDEVIDDLSAVRPEIAELKSKVAEQLKTVDVGMRKDPKLIKAVTMAVYGEMLLERKPEAPKPAKKLVSVQKSDMLSPSPQGGNMSETKLNDEEESYAFQHRLKEKGFDNEEIHDLFVKATKKK